MSMLNFCSLRMKHSILLGLVDKGDIYTLFVLVHVTHAATVDSK